MDVKKEEHDELYKTHIFQMWTRDLDNLLEALEK